MARLALGAKCGNPGSPPEAGLPPGLDRSTSAAGARPSPRRLASAAPPRLTPVRPKKCRRVITSICSRIGSMCGAPLRMKTGYNHEKHEIIRKRDQDCMTSGDHPKPDGAG